MGTVTKEERRKGKLQKEYSVASENEETYDNEKQALRNLKEYSVVSESDDFEVKDRKKSISVISLEKNEDVHLGKPSLQPEIIKADQKLEQTKSAPPQPVVAQADEQKTYSRKKKKG